MKFDRVDIQNSASQRELTEMDLNGIHGGCHHKRYRYHSHPNWFSNSSFEPYWNTAYGDSSWNSGFNSNFNSGGFNSPSGFNGRYPSNSGW